MTPDFKKPKFITFEGGEGSGKSTQSKMLYEYLISNKIKAIHTREVGGTPEAEKIRDILVYSDLYATTELMLVMAARYEHINKVIIPALAGGSWVICDRYVDSTVCYQSGKSGLTIQEIYQLHDKLMTARDTSTIETGIMPDLTFFMDMPPENGLKRVKSRGEANKFEEMDMDFHKEVYDRFKLIADLYKGRMVTIECLGLLPEQIHKKIIDKLNYGEQ